VIKVDATREPHLADAFSVRSAPTVLLADGAGNVTARLVGADAVQEYLALR
jgi:thioredoxin-related protein